MHSRIVLALALSSLLTGCSKPPPFQADLERFVEAVGKSTIPTAQACLTDSAKLDPTLTGGEPEEDSVEVFPVNPGIGRYAWSKVVMQDHKKQEDGTWNATFFAEICMAANENSMCTRPNIYTYRVKMVEVDGAWKIAAATAAEKSIVR